MKRIPISLLLIISGLLHACGPNLAAENKKLREDVLIVHDEVMPQMGKLKFYEKKAILKIDELSVQTPVDTVQLKEFKNLVFELNNAYEGMFVWMRQYDAEDGEKEPLLIKSYLEDQMIQVLEVNQKIKSILEVAEREFPS